MKAISRFVIWIAIAMVAPAGLFADQGEELEQQIHQTEVAIDENAERGNERAVEELKHQLEELREKAARFHEHQSDRNRQIDQQRAQIQEFRNAIEKLKRKDKRDEAAKLHERMQLYIDRLRKERQRHETENDENKQRRERIEHELDELLPKLEELTAAGNHEKAEEVERAIQELRHELTHANRMKSRGQDALIRELNSHRDDLQRTIDGHVGRVAALVEQGKEEAVEQAKWVMLQLRREMARVNQTLGEYEGHEAQERREREGHREHERRREHEERREHEQRDGREREDIHRRIQHMREAMENLHAAGRPDLAEGIAHEAERMEREIHERGRHEEDSHGREAVEALHQLGGQIEHVNNQLDRTNDQLAEVANMLRMLVGKLGIHSDHRNNDRGHREHEGHRPDDDRERSSNHRERHDDDDRDHDRGHEHHTDGEHDDHDGDGDGDGDDRNRGDDNDRDHDDR